MNAPLSWFDDFPVLSALPLEEAILKLHSVGEDEVADALEDIEQETSPSLGFRNETLKWRPFQDQPWLHFHHVFGYLAPARVSQRCLPIRSLDTVPADKTLKKARIKISLERLLIASYPGGGMHRVLFHFAVQHHVPGQSEWVRFNATYRVREGEHASLRDYPIFIGLDVGNEGLSFKYRTINVKNDQEEAFLDYLEPDVFKDDFGLEFGSR